MEYNSGDRPIRRTQGNKVVTMAFDRMGCRVEYHETRAGQVATRPLVMRAKNWDLNLFYTHDGNKNVSEVFYHAPQNGIAAHYDYAPFGAVTRTARATRVTKRDFLSENPFRFSSEYYDFTLGLAYYNYRHYQTHIGRWCARESLEEMERLGVYGFVRNSPVILLDFIGLDIIDNIVNELAENKNSLTDLPCTFVFAVDQPGGSKFSTQNVEERLSKAISELFPKAKILILEKENFNAPDVIGALNAPECICGFFYIGHAGNDDKRPRIIFDPNGTSIGSHIPAGKEAPGRHNLNEIKGKNFAQARFRELSGVNPHNLLLRVGVVLAV